MFLDQDMRIKTYQARHTSLINPLAKSKNFIEDTGPSPHSHFILTLFD